MPMSFGQRPRMRNGVTASVAIRKRMVHVPVKCSASLIGREPRSFVSVRSMSHRAGSTAAISAAVRSQENAPVLSRHRAVKPKLLEQAHALYRQIGRKEFHNAVRAREKLRPALLRSQEPARGPVDADCAACRAEDKSPASCRAS